MACGLYGTRRAPSTDTLALAGASAPPDPFQPQLGGQRRHPIHRHDFWSSKARRFRLRQRSTGNAVVL